METEENWHVYHAKSTFARDQVAAGVRDAMDKNNPLLIRYVLASLLPAALIGQLVETYFANPLLAAPANLIEAAKLEAIAAENLSRGKYRRAAMYSRAAGARLKEASLAILMVVPLGGTAGKLPEGIEYLGTRTMTSVERWAVEQRLVTGTEIEHVFKVEGRLLFVDGFINKAGGTTITTLREMTLVEAKMASRVRLALEGVGGFAADAKAQIIDQCARYLVLNQRLGIGGVRYVITGTAAESPQLVDKLLELFTREYPGEVAAGRLKVVFTPPQ